MAFTFRAVFTSSTPSNICVAVFGNYLLILIDGTVSLVKLLVKHIDGAVSLVRKDYSRLLMGQFH